MFSSLDCAVVSMSSKISEISQVDLALLYSGGATQPYDHILAFSSPVFTNIDIFLFIQSILKGRGGQGRVGQGRGGQSPCTNFINVGIMLNMTTVGLVMQHSAVSLCTCALCVYIRFSM